MKLYNFHRSSASYRVRIALHLKRAAYDYVPVELSWSEDSEQLGEAYRQLNPQQLVPLLEDGDLRIGQTLAIFDYLDRELPEPPLYPRDAAGRARVLGITAYIASEIQPLPNLRVDRYLAGTLGLDEVTRAAWRHHWMDVGFRALEQMLDHPATGAFCHGNHPTAADCFLVPQVANARRARMDLDAYPRVARIVARCLEDPAFTETVSEKMPDFPKPGT